MVVLKTYTISVDITNGLLNPMVLQRELSESGFITDLEGFCHKGDTLEIHGGTLNDEVGLDALVRDHDIEPLWLIKENRCIEIDLKTHKMLALGFVYDGTTFSLSEIAQSHWNAIYDHSSNFPWPITIPTLDDGEYVLELVNVEAFWNTAKYTVYGQYEYGRVLKKQIRDAPDKASVAAIVDDR